MPKPTTPPPETPPLDPAIPWRARRALHVLESQLAEVSKKYRERIKFVEEELDSLQVAVLERDLLVNVTPQPTERFLTILDNPTGGL